MQARQLSFNRQLSLRQAAHLPRPPLISHVSPPLISAGVPLRGQLSFEKRQQQAAKEQAALPPPNLEKVPADVLEVGVTSL